MKMQERVFAPFAYCEQQYFLLNRGYRKQLFATNNFFTKSSSGIDKNVYVCEFWLLEGGKICYETLWKKCICIILPHPLIT